jgi:hypothetical protein
MWDGQIELEKKNLFSNFQRFLTVQMFCESVERMNKFVFIDF